MLEYEIYLPTTNNDGAPIDSRLIQQLKEVLAREFGGYTHLRQRSEGTWRIGSATFRDEVTIVRVLDDGRSNFDMRAFKKTVETALAQETVLIVQREVSVVE